MGEGLLYLSVFLFSFLMGLSACEDVVFGAGATTLQIGSDKYKDKGHHTEGD
jgi:hypothetical protein